MIGMFAVAGRPRRMRQTSVPLNTGRFRSRYDEVRGSVGHGPQRRIAARYDLDLPIAGSLQGMLDQPRDVLLVFDHQNPRCPAHG